MRRIVDYGVFEKHVSPENKALAKDFLVEKKSQGKSETTINGYRSDMNIILYLIYQHFDNKSLTELTRKDIRNLLIIFQEMGMSNARICRLRSTLSSCMEFVSDDDDYEYEFNIVSRVKGLPKVPVREITFLTHEQIEWLIDEALKKNKTIMAMYLALSYYSAKRKSEVHQVMKSGLADQYYTNKVKGKGNKQFRLYYNDRVRDIIRQYLHERGTDDIPDLFVKMFKNGEKKPVTKHAFSYWCDCFTKWLSVREGRLIKINPHCFRHSRLQNAKEEGIPLEKLKSLANHSDVSTTEAYLADTSEDDIADIFGMDASLFKV